MYKKTHKNSKDVWTSECIVSKFNGWTDFAAGGFLMLSNFSELYGLGS